MQRHHWHFKTLRAISIGKQCIFYWEQCFLHCGRLDTVMQTNQPWTRFSIFVTVPKKLCLDLTVSWVINPGLIFLKRNWVEELKEVFGCIKNDLLKLPKMKGNYCLFWLCLFCVVSHIFLFTATLMMKLKRKSLHSVLTSWHCGKRRVKFGYMIMQLLDGPFLCNLKSALTALICSQVFSICRLNK